MGKFVTPSVHLIGYTTISIEGMWNYLKESGNEDFKETVGAAIDQGVDVGEIICSMFAKVCYASLTLGHNDNITRIRDIPDNVRGTISQGHLSVFEHCSLNFMIHNCSRVFTHELVRHRVGTAFSQTSGRYVRGENVDIVFDPILDPVRKEAEEFQLLIEQHYNKMVDKIGLREMKDQTKKKKITSALRRFLPNGQKNEIGFTSNLRVLRHLIQLRTSRHAEWEIRFVFSKIYEIVKKKYSLMFADAKEEVVDDLIEVSGMRQQPYDIIPSE